MNLEPLSAEEPEAPEELGTLVRDEDAYEIADPKHPDHYEALVDIWDNRDKATA